MILIFFNFLFIETDFRWPVTGIHGDKSQHQRDWALNGKKFYLFLKKLITMPKLEMYMYHKAIYAYKTCCRS